MMIFGRTISRLTIAALSIILIIALIAFGTSQCAKRKNQAAQARTDASQAAAASESAKDAIGTVARAGEAQAASEQQTRESEAMIRAAEGASERVNPAVNDAGLRALCRRQSYASAPRCAPFKKDTK